ncbi:MAG: GNAT family N-acetyltransferase [Beijerinckiaceae bacterium]|nr:GNAT family N-acetyltransferase [Beijerinckiaceae bacterium]
MYPDLTCDDIFRIETKRLWLRWPRASDAPAITSFASLAEVARCTAAIPHPYPPGEAERFILKARAENAAGAALILAITHKAGARHTIGIISAIPAAARGIELGYILAPALWRKGLTSEAVKALIDTVFRVTMTNCIFANSRVQNIASRRVLEKTGFAFVDAGLDFLPARGGMHPCDRFRLDRRTWAANRIASGESRGMPPMTQQVHDENSDRELAPAGQQSDV